MTYQKLQETAQIAKDLFVGWRIDNTDELWFAYTKALAEFQKVAEWETILSLLADLKACKEDSARIDAMENSMKANDGRLRIIWNGAAFVHTIGVPKDYSEMIKYLGGGVIPQFSVTLREAIDTGLLEQKNN